MKRFIFILASIIVLIVPNSCKQPDGSSSDLKMNAFVDDLIEKMTLDEKIGQIMRSAEK